jgi:hypothetical protein
MLTILALAAAVMAADPPEPAPATPPVESLLAPELPPVKPPSNETFGLRVGSSTFAGSQGWNDWAGSGARIDFVGQLGRSHIRFLGLISLEGSFLTQVEAAGNPTTDIALTLGAGFRDDTDPTGPTAFLFEFAGTLCGTSNSAFYPVGLHLAIGGRFEQSWELLLSGDVALGFGGRASAAILLGSSF